MTVEESAHVTFDESNPKSVEVKVVDCAGIIEKTYLEDKYQDKHQDQEEDQSKTEDIQAEKVKSISSKSFQIMEGY